MIKAQTFPTTSERERVETLTKYNLLYTGHHQSVLPLHSIITKQFEKKEDIPYIAHNFPAYISDFYGDFVAGDIDDMIIRPNTENAEVIKFVEETLYENDLKERISDIGTEQSSLGFVPLLGWIDADGIYRISKIGQDQYFPQKDGSVIFATYRETSNGLTKNLFCLTQHYRLENGDCVIERQLWECQTNGVCEKPAPFTMVEELFGKMYLETERIVALNDLPIRQIDNTRTTSYGYGKSDYNDIMPQLAEVNERATHISTQLLKNLDAKMILPEGMIDKVTNKVKAFDAISVPEKFSADVKYLNNANALLEDAREQIASLIKVIATLTAVPMWELLKSAMPDRVESLKIQLFATLRRTNRKRARIKRALNDMFRIGMQMKGIKYEEDLIIEFSDVLPIDELNEVNIEQTKITAGISSKLSSIMRVENISEEDAKAEMKRIDEESQIAGIGEAKEFTI